MIEYLIQRNEGIVLTKEESERIFVLNELLLERSNSLSEFINYPLYALFDNKCYGVILLKNEKIKDEKYLYEIEILKKFEPSISVKYSLNEDKTVNIEFLSEGQTSQADVVGTSFDASPLGPIWIVDKKKNKRYKLEDEDFDDIPDDIDIDDYIDDYDIENMEEVEKILRVEKRGDKWCVVHAHPKKKGSKTDKPEGSIIKCFPTKEEADRMHKAIIISKIKRGELMELNDLSDFLDNMKDMTIIKDFISVVGSQIKNYTDKEPNDIDLQIRMDEPTSYLKRAIEVRILKNLPPELQKKVHFIWGDPEGSHDDFLPLFDLKLSKINSNIIKMSDKEVYDINELINLLQNE